jgi:hypothetical protein
MVGEPAASHLAARNTFPVIALEPGVLTVKVRMQASDVVAANGKSWFRCQATNQTGHWETESVAEVPE